MCLNRVAGVRCWIALAAVLAWLWPRVGAGPVSSDPSVASNATPARVLQEPPLEWIMAGRHVYERQCLVCHGKWGDGRGELSVGMVPKPRRLTSGVFKYRSTPSGFLPTDADLERSIRTGVAGTSMPSFAALPDRDVRSVVTYLKTLSSRWRKATHYAASVRLPSPPEWMEDPGRREFHARNGATLFASLCAPCHGIDGAGKGPAAASLEDQWGEPSPPTDLRQPLSRSGPDWIDLYRTLTTGLDGTPMASFAETTTEGDRWDLVAFIRARKEELQKGTKP